MKVNSWFGCVVNKFIKRPLPAAVFISWCSFRILPSLPWKSFEVPWFLIKRLPKISLRSSSLQPLHSVALDLYDLEHLHYPFSLLQSRKPFNSVCSREQQSLASSASSEMLHTFKSEISCNKFPYTHPHYSSTISSFLQTNTTRNAFFLRLSQVGFFAFAWSIHRPPGYWQIVHF